VVAQADDGKREATLPPVEVKSDRESYQGITTRVGKVPQDPHDIPQAITTVTKKLLEEQQVGSLREAMRNVPGVSFNAAEGGRGGDNMNLRGFYTFGDVYLDGIRDTAQYFRETFNLEQIDVLRGAAATLFGRGQAGGTINQVTKTPLLHDQYRLAAGVGTHGYREARADLNESINDDTALRVNLMHRDEGSWRANPANGDEPEIHRTGLAFSLALNRTGAHRFWLNHYQVKTDDVPDYGISFDANTRLPSTRFPAAYFWGTSKAFDRSDARISTAVHEYAIAPGTQLRTQLRVADYERSYWAKTPNLTAAPDARAVAGGNPTRASDYETVTLQSDLSTKFTLAGMKHEALAGVEYLKENSFRHTLQNFGGTTLVNPPDYRPYAIATAGTPSRFKSDSHAIYVQDTVEFVPRWKATLGLRRDLMDATYSSATSPKLRYGENSTRAALSFHPAPDTHYYVSASDAFSPTADLYQLTVSPLPAERSDVVELGAKWLLRGGDLALRASIFRANKHWERSTDLDSTAQILTKKRRTDGIELEAAGRITPRWEMFGGIALLDASILDVAVNVNATTGALTAANPGYQGQWPRNTPPYTLNLWTTYRLDGGWTVGGGVEAKGKRTGYNPSGAGALPTLPGQSAFSPNTAPAYARWDAFVAYEQKSWALKLNLRNLFDKLYYDAVYDNGGHTVPGPRRSAVLTAEVKF